MWNRRTKGKGNSGAVEEESGDQKGSKKGSELSTTARVQPYTNRGGHQVSGACEKTRRQAEVDLRRVGSLGARLLRICGN